MPHEIAFVIVTATRTCNLAKFFNFETSNTLVRVRTRLRIISPHIQTSDNVIILPMHLQTLSPGLRNMISTKILRILSRDFRL
jgi:hypothetical protein